MRKVFAHKQVGILLEVCPERQSTLSRRKRIDSFENAESSKENRVKSDDPDLEKMREDAIDRAQRMDALILSILKTHLLAEQTMNEYLTASGLKKRWVRKPFSAKMKKCKNLAKGEETDPLWDVLEAANNLRNTVAHSLEITAIQEKMAVLKEKYFSSLTERQVDGIKNEAEEFIAMSACATCAGFIATLQLRIPHDDHAQR
jgi:hypothetical protein